MLEKDQSHNWSGRAAIPQQSVRDPFQYQRSFWAKDALLHPHPD